ncbi:MAG: hypothetical protein IKI51_05700, partial [Clostridia bacterium]|nr:hypothetical protein [Clostridia bacterium]
MRIELADKIASLETSVKTSKLEYDRKVSETGDGIIYNKIDGTVTAVREDSDITGEAAVEISGGGGYY